jgi:hypothetical protein
LARAHVQRSSSCADDSTPLCLLCTALCAWIWMGCDNSCMVRANVIDVLDPVLSLRCLKCCSLRCCGVIGRWLFFVRSQSCAAGTYSNTLSYDACTPCPFNTFASNWGQTSWFVFCSRRIVEHCVTFHATYQLRSGLCGAGSFPVGGADLSSSGFVYERAVGCSRCPAGTRWALAAGTNHGLDSTATELGSVCVDCDAGLFRYWHGVLLRCQSQCVLRRFI